MIYHSSNIKDVLDYFQVDSEKGLPTGVVDQRISEHGKNILTKSEKRPLLSLIGTQFKNYANIILIISAIISMVVNALYHTDNWRPAILIIAMLALNVAISIIYQSQSERTARSLETMNIPKVKVLRDGMIKTIDSTFIVPGDILVLETGDYVSADARIIEAVDFRCNQSFVTGEELTAEKDYNAIHEDITPIEERSNMVFCGSNVITGHARAVVTETGMNTEIGKTVTLLETYNSVNVKIKEKLNSVGKVFSVILVLFCVIAFFTNIIINFRNPSPFALTLANSLLNSVALLVSVLPEGLPLMAAVAMGISIKSLLGNGLITKSFSVFDSLSEISVICSDKTGTLTQDKMQTEKIFNGKYIIDADSAYNDKTAVTILRLASLCTSQSKEDIDNPMYNDATELAIIHTFKESVVDEERDIYNNYPLLCKLPFDSEKKITLTVNMIDGVPYAIAKGAPDYLLKTCNCENNEAYLKTVDDFAKSGLRVIAVTFRQLNEIPSNPEYSELEKDMNFAGLIALSDPPRDDSISLVEECNNGGIRTVMITGDHINTACAVARKLGILKDDSEAISGDELDKLSDEQLKENIHKYSVFARLLPDQKFRIVSALKAVGMTVAITGDSVNDAAALKIADVGIAMGYRGTDVARGAADIIMNNNRFSAIITAINKSRGLFCALRKSLVYLLSSNVGELISVLVCLFAFGVFPISALQFLLLNIVTDIFPIMSILSDGIHEHKSLKAFKNSDKALFTVKSSIMTAVQGLSTAVAAITAYSVSVTGGAAYAATMMFTVLVFAQILNMVSNKFEDFFFKYRHFRSGTISLTLFLTVFLSLLLVLTSMGSSFGFVQLTYVEFFKALLISSTVFITGELTKVGFMIYEKLK